MTASWGLRLGAYLLARKLGDPEEDRRYARMRRAKGDRFVLWSLGMIFGLQGLLVLVVSLPITASSVRRGGDRGGFDSGGGLFARRTRIRGYRATSSCGGSRPTLRTAAR